MIATDLAPHDPASKLMERFGPLFAGDRDAAPLAAGDAEALAGAANGVVGLETALGLALELVHNRVISASRMVELMALNPARLLRLERQGTLMPGALADIAVIDPDAEWIVAPDKFRSRSRNTPFGGRRLKGIAAMTIVGGHIVYRAEGRQ
jgi:dihydroorotase